MLDINGREVVPKQIAQLLCEVLSADPDEGVAVRILNSETELVVGCKHDEALGGVVADSEFAVFDGQVARSPDRSIVDPPIPDGN